VEAHAREAQDGAMSTTYIRLLAALLLVTLTACAPLATSSVTPVTEQSRTGGILRVGQNASDLGTLDPHFASGTQDRALVDMVYNGLLRFKPGDTTSFEPDLAAALPVATTDAAGHQVWTFNLRHGVMCQPSEGVQSYELTSDDVVYSLQKAASKDTSAYASDYAGMTFGAPQPYTVTVTLDQPLSQALFFPRVANYSGGYIICKRAAEALGPDGLKTHPVGTGPFTFQSYSPKDKVDLVANSAYFRGQPQLDGVEYRYIADLNTRELGLRTGQLDVIAGQADDHWVGQIHSDPNLDVDVFGVGEVSTVFFNTSKPPFDKIQVRQAVVNALSRDEFQALFGSLVAQKVYSPVPEPFMAGGLTEADLAARKIDTSFDTNKARALLKDAGLENGFAFSVVTSEMPAYRVLYESMQAQLARVGIKMDVKVVDHAAMHDQIRKDVNPVVIYNAFRPSADAYLTQFFHSDAIVVSGKAPNTNFAHYDKVDEEIDGARHESDANRQEALWKQAQTKALQDVVAYPILYQDQVYARSRIVDYGHDLMSMIQLYPGIDERTRFRQ
jgi:peptide/nickel transport system substrate-binding protein